MTWVRALALAGAVLGGCATAPRPADPGLIGGRLAVQVAAQGDQPARSLNSAFELRGNDERGALDLLSPLGSVLAQAGWQPGSAWLVTSQGRREFANLDALSREVLGEIVPVAALFDWLRGRPWPGAPSAPTGSGFAQLGWEVDLARFADAQVAARRDAPPAVTVRAALERAP